MSEQCPERIYLQACDKCYAELIQIGDGITWCEDGVGHECDEAETMDIEYIRLDVHDKMVDKLREQNRRLAMDGQRLYRAVLNIRNAIDATGAIDGFMGLSMTRSGYEQLIKDVANHEDLVSEIRKLEER